MDELGIYTPKMIEDRVEVKKGDLLFLHTGWHKHAQFGSEPDEEKYIHRHPGAHPDMVPWLLEKEIHIWGVDCVSTDHPMNLPIGRFLGKGMQGHCDRVRKQAEEKFGGPEAVAKLFPDSAYQLTHNALFPKNCMHIENIGGDIDAPGAAEQAADPRLLPVEVQRAARRRLPASWRSPATGSREQRSSIDPASELRRLVASREVTAVSKSWRRRWRASSAQRHAQRRRHAQSARAGRCARRSIGGSRRANRRGRCAGCRSASRT